MYLPRAPMAFALALVCLAAMAAFPVGAGAAMDLTAKVRVGLTARPALASGAAQDFAVRDGGVLRSGDGVQLRVQTDADAYVYVIAFGSSGSALLLHPFSAKPGDALVRRGQGAVVPASGVFLPLDDQEGQETLFTIVSSVPLADIADLLPRLESHGGDVSAATDTIRAAYPRARRLSFKHIGARPLVGVAATTPRASPSQPSAGTAAGAQSDTFGIGSASPSTSGAGGWSVSTSQGFGTAEPSPSGAAAAGTSESGGGRAAEAVQPATSPSTAGTGAAAAVATSRDGQPEPLASDAPPPAESGEVSAALRKAREAAGIDEQKFRGILATLPGSDQVQVPESIRRRPKEQGVLSAEGSRIRALDSVRLQSEDGWPRDDGDSRTKIQN